MRLIDASLLIDEIKNIQTYKIDRDFEKLIPLHSALATIRDALTMDMKPVIHGKWVDKCARDWHCSACGKPSPIQFDGYCVADQLEYCARCGAKMDEIR